MSWGGLNPALTAWRTAVMRRFPDKDTASDGARADKAHGSTSQHQPDADGTVDGYDMDVNLLRGTPESGSPWERRLIEAMKLDFKEDPHNRGQLWIHQRKIANRSFGPWSQRDYTGANAHDKHVHWESRQAREDDGRLWPMPHTDMLLEEMNDMKIEDLESERGQRALAKAVLEAPVGRSGQTVGVILQRSIDDEQVVTDRLEQLEQMIRDMQIAFVNLTNRLPAPPAPPQPGDGGTV